MHDIQALHVPHLPLEKLGDVDQLQHHGNNHRVTQTSELVLLRCVAQQKKSPTHHPETTVCEHFHVPTQNPRVELRSPIVIEYGVAAGAGIGR